MKIILETMIDGIKPFLPVLTILIILDLILYLSYKTVIGKAGEFHVKNQIKKLPKDKYLIINDLLIIVNEISHQIDHVVVSPYGIFVIETKQYNGYNTGNEYDKKWKQNNKYYINNPIHQNYGHVKALEELLNINNDKFIPIVCIPSRAKVKVKSKSHVLRYYNLNSTILSYKEEIVENYNEIYNKLQAANVINKELRKEHIKYAKQVKNEKDYESINKCPKCGGKLIKKHGKYGEFIGCSNYPRCKYIQK